MANQSGTGSVFNLPNFAGQLYSASPIITPLLNMISAKAVKTENFQFPTGVEYAHENAGQPTISETDSLTAPTAVSYVRIQNSNVTQIFQEKISVSYMAQSNAGRLTGINTAGAQNSADNPLDFQVRRALEKIARDVEYTFLNGAYQLASASNVANKTRGLLALTDSAATNLASNNVAAALTQTNFAISVLRFIDIW